MYLLRSPVIKICFCKAIPLSGVNLTSPAACPLCRLVQLSSTIIQTYRQQSTNVKTSVVCLQLSKKKTKTGEYSELIQVEEASGNSIKQSTPVIKKSSTSEILESLSTTTQKKKCKQTLATTTKASKLSSRKHSPEHSVKSSSSRALKSASQLSPTKSAKVAKTVKKVTKKMGSQSEKTSKSKSVEISAQDVNLTLDNVATVDEFTANHSYNLDNIHVPKPDPTSQSFGDKNDEVVELDKSVLTKIEAMAENESLCNGPIILKAHERESTAKIKQTELDKVGNDLQFNLSLKAFLDVCISSDKLVLAHNTLMSYRKKGKFFKHVQKITDVSLINAVLIGHAKKGNWIKIKELLAAIESDGTKPNLQTYAGCLECISRLPDKDKNIISFILKEAEKTGLDFANLDHECCFVNDQRERVIKMVRLVHPDFQPTQRENHRQYSCNLLSRLNEEPPGNRFYDPSGGTITYAQLIANLSKQIDTEVSNSAVVRSIENGEADENLKRTRSECEAKWKAVLLRAFEEKVNKLNNHQVIKSGKLVTLHPFLTALNLSVYVDIMLSEIRSLAESSDMFSLPLTTLHTTIGSKVMDSYMIAIKQKQGLVSKIESLYRIYCEYYVDPKLTSRYTPRQYWEKITNENMGGPSIDIDDKLWPQYLIGGIGKFLYDIIIREVMINTNLLNSEDNQGLQIPAFYNIYRNRGVHEKHEIKPHPILVDLYQSGNAETLTFEGNVVPSLVPPLPWTSIRSGGYLLSSVKMIRLAEGTSHQKLKLEKTPHQQLLPIYDSLNHLGECPWKINKPILDVIIEIFNNKGDEKLGISPPASECPPLPTLSLEMSKEEKIKTHMERARLLRKRCEMHSLRCDALYKLSIANHFRDEIFWFPHNLDFRGRTYPCPPHFNHLGGDMSRGILLFAKGEPLGEKGLDWLKIHLINLTGLKKQEAICKRLEFANEMIPEIIDSADNPLNGRRWWTKLDKPLQALACCKEIVNAMRSPDAEKYICHFPVHQDGSCNGLQHYAALGRDEQGAEQVNLCPADEPHDVYNGVANLVEKERAKDAEAGINIAKVLEGFIERKIIKQTVMTTVYGVTRYGARCQISKQLKDLSGFPEKHVWKASMYLTEKTFVSLQQMFTATREIQEWLTEVARLISQVCGQPVEWVTPLGLPVIQPYHRPMKTCIPLGIGKIYQMSNKLEVFLRPNVMKQKNAFPPNFIHSLDSTHMMLTSLFCQREGITFVSVHDCYWTHPSKSIEIMNAICREQFVALHNEPILENLSKFLTQKYSYSQDEFKDDTSVVGMAKRKLNNLILRVPTTGNFDLKNVLKSTYFFS